MNEQPRRAILKTFPMVFFREVTKRYFIEEFVRGLNDPKRDGLCWYVPLSGLPKHPVSLCYIVINNRIKYRANIVEIQPGREIEFDDGRTFHPRAWMLLSGPVVRAPHRIDRRGFQGFRYCEEYF